MTRQETLKHFKTWCQNNIGNHCSDEDFQMANNIMALLEQKPVLDKVRAEIDELEEGISSYHNDRPWVFKDEVLQIINRYKAESEE